MSERRPQLVGLGNALVDVLADAPHEAISRHGLRAGGMHLVDDAAAAALYEEIGPGVRMSGGSVANTVAHSAGLGVSCEYVGKVARDDLGDAFAADFADLGIGFHAPRATDGTGTGRCVVLVTPDGERTMSTFLGAAVTLTPEDVTNALPPAFGMLLVEGYLFDAPNGAEAIERACVLARKAGAKIALTPSDAGCVDRHRGAIQDFIGGHCDILVGNHEEICAIAELDDPVEGLKWAAQHTELAAVTQGEKGSWVADGHGVAHIAAQPVDRVVDLTGAGDAYAAGLLSGLILGESPADAGVRGAKLAATVIVHHGARKAKAEAAS
ncbi:MAG: adenosine kinase [Pseudomonadota bacterium]